jgi:site-specific DNA recombinase
MYRSANRNRGTCSNHKLIRREEVEERVLSGLKAKPLDPDLITEFVTEFESEYNRLMKVDNCCN